MEVPLKIRDVMSRLGYAKPDPVYRLLNTGQLRGHPIATRPGGRPRWRVYPADVQAFLDAHRNAGAVAAAPTPRPLPLPAKRYIDRSPSAK